MKKTKFSSEASLLSALKKGPVVMIELPADHYLEHAISSVKKLIAKGYEGIYISFQRPFSNLSHMLRDQGVNMNKLLVVDLASSLGGESRQQDPRNIHISNKIKIDELVRSIYTSVPKLSSKKKFVMIDSLTTLTLYKPLSETMRFLDFLMRMVKKDQSLALVINVADDLVQKKFIQDVALRVSEVVTK